MDLTIKNIGPVVDLSVIIPDDRKGGVVVFKADNGGGKSTCINSTRAILGGKVRLYSREIITPDGTVAHANGEVKLGDRVLSVGGQQRAKGKLEDVATIEGRFDLADLVSPSYDEAETRDAARVKALLDITGAKGDIALFYDLVGGKENMDGLLTVKEQGATDLVAMAKKVKSKLEAKARECELVAENAESNARTAAAAADGVDLTKPDDANALTKALTDATTHATKLKAQRSTYIDAKSQAEQARAKLAEHEKTAVSVAEIEGQLATASDAAKKTAAAVAAARKALADAETEYEKAAARVTSLNQTMDAAQSAERAVAGWREQIAEFEKLPQPDDAEIVKADTACQEAREAMEQGSVIRHAKEKVKEAEGFTAKAKVAHDEAVKYREQAAAVFDVLSKHIPEGPLYVDNGKLVIDTEDRKAEPFDQLSDGERGKVAIQYAIDACGDGGYVTLPQSCWDGLSPANKQWIAEYSESHGVWTFTGEVSEGELRAETFEPQTAA